MLVAFDLDECLIATREAHERAFAAVGVQPPGGENRYKPARYWLHSQEAHDAKHVLFPEYALKWSHMLPACRFARPGDYILTGTSERSFKVIAELYPHLKQMRPVAFGMGPDQKLEWMRCQPPGVYFDDWTEMVHRVRGETHWQSIDVSGF